MVDPHILRRAAACFQGGSEAEFYDQAELYGLYAERWHQFFPAKNRLYAKELEGGYRNSQPMPDVVDTLVDNVLAEKPGMVGISICYNEQFWFGICIAKRIKERSNLPIVMGGTYFIEDSEAVLNHFHDVVDYIIAGEAELALAQLLSHPESLEEVPGLWWREEGKARFNTQIFERKLDTFGHPDFSDLDLNGYYTPEPVLPILTSRGCYWQRCAFCTHYQSYGLSYRMHSIDFVIDEMKRHIANGIRHFALVDEILAASRFDQMAAAILKEGLDVRYYAMSRPTKEFSRERLQRIYDSGCRFMMWGMESANQRVLDLMDKGTVKADVEELLHAAADVGLYNHVFIFFGFPTETREEAIETLQFLHDNRGVIHEVLRGTFGLDRGSPIFDNPKAFSITKMKPVGGYPHTDQFNYKVSTGMSSGEASALLNEAIPYLRCFNMFTRHLGKNREHSSLIYSRLEGQLDPSARHFQPFSFGDAADDAGEPTPEPQARPKRDADHAGDDAVIVGSAPEGRPLRLSILRAALRLGASMRVFWRIKHRRNRERYPDFEIAEYPGFLSESECEYLIEIGRPEIDSARGDSSPNWMRAIGKRNKVSIARNDTIWRIKERIAGLTQTDSACQERIQVVHYGAREFAPLHSDDAKHDQAGAREFAVILYLSDDFEGGGNYFPELGQSIAPERGKAVVFRLLRKGTDESHPMARHLDEMVLSGEKWVCNQWIRQRSYSSLERKSGASQGASGRRRTASGRSRRKAGGRQRRKKK